jgi:hypothetical protein
VVLYALAGIGLITGSRKPAASAVPDLLPTGDR